MAARPRVVLDACVLHPFHLRNLFVQLAADDVIEAFWTDAISAEWVASVNRSRGISTDHLLGQVDLMNGALPEANLQDWRPMMEGVELPDSKDRHVLAAARSAQADIVTWNLGDFPEHVLREFGIRAFTPDEFLVEIFRLDAPAVAAVVDRARGNLTRTSPDWLRYLEILERQGAVNFVAAVRALHLR